MRKPGWQLRGKVLNLVRIVTNISLYVVDIMSNAFVYGRYRLESLIDFPKGSTEIVSERGKEGRRESLFKNTHYFFSRFWRANSCSLLYRWAAIASWWMRFFDASLFCWNMRYIILCFAGDCGEDGNVGMEWVLPWDPCWGLEVDGRGVSSGCSRLASSRVIIASTSQW